MRKVQKNYQLPWVVKNEKEGCLFWPKVQTIMIMTFLNLELLETEDLLTSEGQKLQSSTTDSSGSLAMVRIFLSFPKVECWVLPTRLPVLFWTRHEAPGKGREREESRVDNKERDMVNSLARTVNLKKQSLSPLPFDLNMVLSLSFKLQRATHYC